MLKPTRKQVTAVEKSKKMWEKIRDENISKEQYFSKYNIPQKIPRARCYLCEIWHEVCHSSIPISFTAIIKCPLGTKNLHCFYASRSPFYGWDSASTPESKRYHANRIVKAHDKWFKRYKVGD